MRNKMSHNILVSAWNAFLLAGIVYLIEWRGWDSATLLWIFLLGANWR